MRSRRAIILAANAASFIEAAGRLMIDRQLDALRRCGIEDVTIVTGSDHQRLRDYLGSSVTFVQNTSFRQTGSIYSLWLTQHLLRQGALVLHAHAHVTPWMLQRLIDAAAPDAVLVDCIPSDDRRAARVKVSHGLVVDFSSELTLAEADGESFGILKFGPEGGRHLVRHLDALLTGGASDASTSIAFRSLAQVWPLCAVAVNGEFSTKATIERSCAA